MRCTLGRFTKKKKACRGAALVEFALIAPVFLAMVLGIVEFSRAMTVQQLLTNASREGARIASYSSTTQTSTVSATVNSFLANDSISGATVTVSPTILATVSNGQPVTVTVSIPFNSVSLLNPPWFLGGQTLQVTSVMCRQPAP